MGKRLQNIITPVTTRYVGDLQILWRRPANTTDTKFSELTTAIRIYNGYTLPNDCAYLHCLLLSYMVAISFSMCPSSIFRYIFNCCWQVIILFAMNPVNKHSYTAQRNSADVVDGGPGSQTRSMRNNGNHL